MVGGGGGRGGSGRPENPERPQPQGYGARRETPHLRPRGRQDAQGAGGAGLRLRAWGQTRLGGGVYPQDGLQFLQLLPPPPGILLPPPLPLLPPPLLLLPKLRVLLHPPTLELEQKEVLRNRGGCPCVRLSERQV